MKKLKRLLLKLWRAIFPKCIINDGDNHSGRVKKTSWFMGQVTIPVCEHHKAKQKNIEDMMKESLKNSFNAEDIIATRIETDPLILGGRRL